jgi:hypothetical protein
MAKWHETDNGVRTLQSIARNLETLTDQPSITPRDLFAAHAMSAYMKGEMVVSMSELARDSFVMADAMMVARKQ